MAPAAPAPFDSSGPAASRLAPTEWMAAAETRAVLDALGAEGGEARFVGGAVRDALLGRAVTDIDIGTPTPPARAMALLERAGLRALPTGIEHGTVTALAGGKRYEITTLRRDLRTDGRHAEVAFTDDWRADAARRDFTINAMSCAPDGMLYDYFSGRRDLAAGRVRFVGTPATRIAEDRLRLLRFFRFHAWYGRGAPDAVALVACAAAVHTLGALSGERVRGEMTKLLAAADPAPSLAAMGETRVLAAILPEAPGTALLARLVAVEAEAGFAADPIRRLGALVLNAAAAEAVTARWRLTGAEGARLAALAAPAVALAPSLDRRAQRRALYRIGRARFLDLALLSWAARGEGEAFRTMLEIADAWEEPRLPVRGADVLALGIEAGPEVGRLLADVEAWWVAQDFAPDRAAALARLAALAADAREA